MLQYVKITAIIGAVIVGEPNNSTETAVYLYAKDLSEQYIGRWNDTYNKYDGSNSYFSYRNCGIICEWENNPGDTSSGDSCFVKLSNGLFAKLDKDPALGDYTVDTDGDGLCDLEELNTVINIHVFNPYDGLGAESYKTISAWSFTSNPAKADTDGDGLSDYDEVYTYYTVPLKKDTDGDGLSDGKEININYDPNASDNYFNIYFENSDDDENVVPSVEIKNISGSQAESLDIQPVDEYVLLDENIPGYIGKAFDFSIDGTFETAIISFEFNSDLLNLDNFEPCIYYYDEETQLLEELPNQTINDNIVTVETTHFSKYILLNKNEYNKIWENDIRKPSENYQNMDIVFVIDISYSMYYNDPESIRKTVTNNFINNLREGDRSALVAFRGNAEIKQGLTFNRNDTITAVNALQNDDGSNSLSGTNGSQGLHTAFEIFNEQPQDNVEKVIVFLTDGEDTTTSYDYNEIISQAKKDNICIYSIGLGNNIDETILKNIASQTNGKYYKSNIATDLITDFNSIFNEYIDYYTDFNNDGISDYFTSLMCSGVLVTGTGKNLFEGIPLFEIQKNNDYDGDGIINGEEVEVIFNSKFKRVYLNVKSSPIEKDADKDGVYDNEDKSPLIYEYANVISRGEFGSVVYNNEIYNIVVPDNIGQYIVPSNQEEWESTKIPKGEVTNIDGTKIIAGLLSIELGEDYNDPKTSFQKTGALFFTGALTVLNESIENHQIVFDFQKRGNERRVIIYAGTSGTIDQVNQYANNIPYSVHMKNENNPVYQSLLSSDIKNYYENVTGKKAKYGRYDLQITVDSRHKEYPYVSYLWIDTNHQIIETPIIYPNDKVELGTLDILWRFNKLLDIDISRSTIADSRFQSIFGQIYS